MSFRTRFLSCALGIIFLGVLCVMPAWAGTALSQKQVDANAAGTRGQFDVVGNTGPLGEPDRVTVDMILNANVAFPHLVVQYPYDGKDWKTYTEPVGFEKTTYLRSVVNKNVTSKVVKVRKPM